MKLYKVHFQSDSDCSDHFGFFGSLRKADKATADWKTQNKEQGFDNNYTEISEINFGLDKESIIRLLNKHAGHADNG
jgi:hypothetical protein